MEDWKDVKGYEGLYMVSSYGRMKALAKHRKVGISKGFRTYPELIMKQRPNRTGYYYISMCKDGSYKSYTVHRLVAKHFVENPDSLEIVNHLDTNKLNNHFDNLQWTTILGNSHHAVKSGCFKRKPEYFCRTYKRIQDNNTGQIFSSVSEAARFYKINHHWIRKMISGTKPNTLNIKHLT